MGNCDGGVTDVILTPPSRKHRARMGHPHHEDDPKWELGWATQPQKCLRLHPLAALDPRFNDIAPSDPYK
jgi:hypothetical protein